MLEKEEYLMISWHVLKLYQKNRSTKYRQRQRQRHLKVSLGVLICISLFCAPWTYVKVYLKQVNVKDTERCGLLFTRQSKGIEIQIWSRENEPYLFAPRYAFLSFVLTWTYVCATRSKILRYITMPLLLLNDSSKMQEHTSRHQEMRFINPINPVPMPLLLLNE